MSSRTSLGALALLTVAAAATVAAPAQAINYIPSANGITWDVNDAAMPGLDTGSIRATTDNSVLSVAGLRVSVDGTPKHRMDGELLRGFGLKFDGVDEFATTQAVNLSGIEISRHLKFARTANWGRWVDSLRTPPRARSTCGSRSAASSARTTARTSPRWSTARAATPR